MSLLPSFRAYETTLCEPDGEREGWQLELSWGRWTVAFVIARRMPEIGL